MKQTTKNHLSLIKLTNSQGLILSVLFLGFIALVILIASSRPPKLYTELIINTHNNMDLSDISIFYTDVDYNNIESYNLAPTGLEPKKEDYIPYSEGFIEKNTFQTYKSLFEVNNIPLTSTFQTYYETKDFVFFAFPGDISTVRILDKSTGNLHPLKLSSSVYRAPMYVSHIVAVENSLIIVAGEARSYHALIYLVDLTTFEVTHSKRLQTHTSALDTPHYTLTDDGTAIWIAEDGLQVYKPFTNQENMSPLPFTPTGVTSDENTIFAYSLENNQLKGVSLNTKTLSEPRPITISLPLPTSTVQLIDLQLKNNTLAVALYDATSARFQQYIVLYDLLTHTMTYCLGIENTAPLILADLHFS